ncbi:hypothetical protein CsSME_00037846 [Camellia sinensis var. sinensis]
MLEEYQALLKQVPGLLCLFPLVNQLLVNYEAFYLKICWVKRVDSLPKIVLVRFGAPTAPKFLNQDMSIPVIGAW